VTIWDDANSMQRASYAEHCRQLYGATIHNFKDVPSVQGSVEGNRIRFDKLVIPYATTYAHIRSSLAREIRNSDTNTPRFLSYQVSIWGEMKPDKIVELSEDLNREFPGKVEFVRADHYFSLYNQDHGLPFNLLLAPTTVTLDGAASANLEVVSDGTPNTVWTSSEAGKQWLAFDFGAVHQISRYVIRHAGAGGMRPEWNTRSFLVQTGVDGATWTTLDVVQGNTSDVSDVEFEPVKARYVKITVTDAGADSTARIAEVEIFGSKARR
jgi:hypothetical protein